MKVLISLVLFSPKLASADIKWPLYNQQCRDDAGSPFLDDAEIYGPNGFYHDTAAATPVLQDGKCPKPLEKACQDRPTYKAAFLEGPIDCGNNGWYCRIMPDENWQPYNLISDLNFGHCNTTEGIDDAGYDRDGHCHGSSVDSTYYWWVRDHFFRQYNGRLRCCCGWYEDTSSTPMYGRRIANRCDYRRLVTETENIEDCRDANEDHGLGFDDIGCDPDYKSTQLNKPIPEDDSICWEVQKFGYSDDGTGGDDEVEGDDETGGDDQVEGDDKIEGDDETGDDSVSKCLDSTVRFKLRWNGKKIRRDCKWVANKATKQRCNVPGVSEICALTCGTCSICADSTVRFRLWWKGRKISRDCKWVGNKAVKQRCNVPGVSNACRSTCGQC